MTLAIPGWWRVRGVFERGWGCAKASYHVVKSLGQAALGRADYQRWREPKNLEAWWETRTAQIARLIPAGSRVLEFGAGRCYLKRHLDPNCTYVPSDLVERGPGTLVLDLNQRPLPPLHEHKPEVAVFSGVLEYLNDVEGLAGWLNQHFGLCVASYTCVERKGGLLGRMRLRARRLEHGFRNEYTEEGLVELFARHGWVCKQRDSWTDQRIFLFVNERGSGRSSLEKTEVTRTEGRP